MKHFNKLNCVVVQINFPETWGSISERVNLSDEIWPVWEKKLTAVPKALAAVKDVSNGFDVLEVRFEVINFKSEAHLDKTIDWVEKQLHKAYKEVQNARRLSESYEPQDA